MISDAAYKGNLMRPLFYLISPQKYAPGSGSLQHPCLVSTYFPGFFTVQFKHTG